MTILKSRWATYITTMNKEGVLVGSEGSLSPLRELFDFMEQMDASLEASTSGNVDIGEILTEQSWATIMDDEDYTGNVLDTFEITNDDVLWSSTMTTDVSEICPLKQCTTQPVIAHEEPQTEVSPAVPQIDCTVNTTTKQPAPQQTGSDSVPKVKSPMTPGQGVFGYLKLLFEDNYDPSKYSDHMNYNMLRCVLPIAHISPLWTAFIRSTTNYMIGRGFRPLKNVVKLGVITTGHLLDISPPSHAEAQTDGLLSTRFTTYHKKLNTKNLRGLQVSNIRGIDYYHLYFEMARKIKPPALIAPCKYKVTRKRPRGGEQE